MFGGHYRELGRHRERIVKVMAQEEASGSTKRRGAGTRAADREILAGKQSISGEEAFQLHDTYGFSIELNWRSTLLSAE